MRSIPRSVELLLGLGLPTRTPHCVTRNSLNPAANHRQTRSLATLTRLSSPRLGSPRLGSPRLGGWPSCQAAASGCRRPSASPKHFRRHAHHLDMHRLRSAAELRGQCYAAQVDALRVALRQNDTLKLYFSLLDLTSRAKSDDPSFCSAIQAIPPTTFSEILRHFDPAHIAHHVDSAPGLPISWGAAIHTPLGDLVNKWGVKILYVRILNRLLLLQTARRQPLAGPHGMSEPLRPLLNDYVVLLRCAGATSNIAAARDIWHAVLTDGYGSWKHSDLYAEFIKARYLTEALYANNDLARFRLRPIDMHRNGATLLTNSQHRLLKNLSSRLIDKYSHRFGQNLQELFFAEPLTRLLRKRKPLRRLQHRVIVRHMVPGDELLLCAILKANGRNGQLRASNLLMKIWGINISIYKTAVGNRQISGGYDFAPGAALAPTQALLDAVVHCYGNMGEIALASTLVDFISRRWNMAVPDSVWSDLLSFARIHSTEPAAREWRIAEMPNKITRPGMVVKLFWQCTQGPYDFRPSMKDYDCLVKSMLRPMRPLRRPLEAIRQLTPLYHQLVKQVQVAWAELILTTQQGVPNLAAYRRYRMLQARKNYFWYCFHYTSRQVLSRLKPASIHDENAVRLIPAIVAELGSFMPPSIEYRIATGIVELRLDNAPMRMVVATQTLQQVKPSSPRPLALAPPQDTDDQDLPGDVDLVAVKAAICQSESSAVLQEMIDGNSRQDERGDRAKGGSELRRMCVDHEKTIEDQGMAGEDTVVDVADLKKASERARSENFFQDALEESRSPGHTSAVSKGLDKHPRREAAAAGDPFQDALASAFQDSAGLSGQQSTDDEVQNITTNDIKAIWRQSKSRQLLRRPAYMIRPRYSGPADEPSLSRLRQEGKEFTGFHQDASKKHYAAHRIIREMQHAPGLPVDLDGAVASEGRTPHERLMEQLLRVTT